MRRISGTSILELAVALPIFLIFVFGIIEFGIYFMQYQVLHDAARANARSAALFRTTCSSAALEAEAIAAIIDRAGESGIDLSAGDIDVDGTCEEDPFVTVDLSLEYNFAVLSSLVGSIPEFMTMNVDSIAANQNYQE